MIAHAEGTTAPKRDVPDYDGRGKKSKTAGDALLWIPRVLFSPLYFTTEYVLRRPLGAFLTWAERSKTIESFYDFFAFGPNHSAGFAPIAFIDFGFNPSVGIYLFWDDALVKGNSLAFHGTTWGADWLAGVWSDTVHIDARDTFSFNTTAIRRPDHTYFGPGPKSLEANVGRYGETMVDTSAKLELKRGPAKVTTVAGFRSADFYEGHYGNDPPIGLVAAYPLPDGFTSGYTEVYERVELAIDSRRPRPAPGHGVRVELAGENGSDLRGASGWIRYGGTVGGFVDLTGTQRVLSLSFTALFADPLGRDPIPFTELVSLGGDQPMRGFYPGRLVGRSAAVLTAHYRWPIWMWLDGSLIASVGNVFGEHLDGFRPGLLRFSGAIGLETTYSPTSAIEVLVGFGTETFDHGAAVNEARVSIGTSRGF
ncbi:MAG TPA: BamA/TamA family outer membrane protein [Polyangiaceae bacterium]